MRGRGIDWPTLAALAALSVPLASGQVFPTAAEAAQVDALVTNPQGLPVLDLTAADFEILRNNVPQQVLSAAYVRNPRTVLLVVDDLGLGLDGINAVRAALGKFVDERMRPGVVVTNSRLIVTVLLQRINQLLPLLLGDDLRGCQLRDAVIKTLAPNTFTPLLFNAQTNTSPQVRTDIRDLPVVLLFHPNLERRLLWTDFIGTYVLGMGFTFVCGVSTTSAGCASRQPCATSDPNSGSQDGEGGTGRLSGSNKRHAPTRMKSDPRRV
jgi:hypothetical protein